MTRRLLPLPQAFQQAKKMASEEDQSNWPRYRSVYEMALDGEIPAQQIRGRWHASPGVIAAMCKSPED
jgi:hypothetical protein